MSLPPRPDLDTGNINAMHLEIGASLPPRDPHGVSVSLPRWKDTVGWATRDKRVLDRMTTGYPRFFVPCIVRKLAAKIVDITFSLSISHQNLSITFSPGHASSLDALLVPTRDMSVECSRHL